MEFSLIKFSLIWMTLISQVLAGTDTDEGQKLYEDLFKHLDVSWSELKPHKVVDMLEHLVNIFESNSYDSNQPVYQPDNQEKIKDLFNVITNESCDQELIVKFKQQLRSLSDYGNLVKALKAYRDHRFRVCKEEYSKPIFNYAKTFDEEKKLFLIRLRGTILDNLRFMFDYTIPFYPQEVFDKSVFEYLAKYPGSYEKKWKKDKMLSKTELAALYDEQIVSICSSLGQTFYKEAEFFLNEVVIYKEVAKLIDNDARYWVIDAYMCQDAMKRKEEVLENVYTLMEKSRRNIFTKAFKKGVNCLKA